MLRLVPSGFANKVAFGTPFMEVIRTILLNNTNLTRTGDVSARKNTTMIRTLGLRFNTKFVYGLRESVVTSLLLLETTRGLPGITTVETRSDVDLFGGSFVVTDVRDHETITLVTRKITHPVRVVNVVLWIKEHLMFYLLLALVAILRLPGKAFNNLVVYVLIQILSHMRTKIRNHAIMGEVLRINGFTRERNTIVSVCHGIPSRVTIAIVLGCGKVGIRWGNDGKIRCFGVF